MSWLGIAFVLAAVFYGTILLLVWLGLNRLKSPEITVTPTISIIIAARNEARRITPCLQSLEQLDYPADRYEVILVDDQSTDETPSMIAAYCERHANWQAIFLSEKSTVLRGKKSALLHAVQKSRGDIIFTTDADCIVPPGWLRHMARYFAPDVAMVLGYSPLLEKPGFWQRVLQFDNLFSAIVAAAPTMMGYPFTSMGRNLAYRRAAYEQVGGYEALRQFRSGDDIHLTERFRQQRVGRIVFCADARTFVQTRPPDTRREVFHQQVRKNSKVLRKSRTSVAFSLLLVVAVGLFLALPFLEQKVPEWLTVWLVVMFLVFLGEWFCLWKAARIFHQRQLLSYLPLMLVWYPVHILFFSFLGAFDVYEWKNQA